MGNNIGIPDNVAITACHSCILVIPKRKYVNIDRVLAGI